MSHEYRVELAIPYVVLVRADSAEQAEEKALEELRRSVGWEEREGAPNCYDLLTLPDAVVSSVEEVPLHPPSSEGATFREQNKECEIGY